MEHDVCAATGTSLADVDGLEALRVLHHAQQAKQNAALDRNWQLQVRMWRWAKPADQRRVLAQLQNIAMPGRVRSAFDYCRTDEERLRLIGLNVNCHGQRWLDGHETQLAWLTERGYSVAQASEADREWTREQYRRHKYRNVPAWLKAEWDQERRQNGDTYEDPAA